MQYMFTKFKDQKILIRENLLTPIWWRSDTLLMPKSSSPSDASQGSHLHSIFTPNLEIEHIFEFGKDWCHCPIFDLSVAKKGWDMKQICPCLQTDPLTHLFATEFPTNNFISTITHLMCYQRLNSIAHVADAKGDYELVVPLEKVTIHISLQIIFCQKFKIFTLPRRFLCHRMRKKRRRFATKVINMTWQLDE